MKILKEKTYYAPSFLDHSRDSRGRPTGDLHATVFTRTFSLVEGKNGKHRIRAAMGFLFPRWEKDTKKAQANAISKSVKGMNELATLDKNFPLNFIPDEVERALA